MRSLAFIVSLLGLCACVTTNAPETAAPVASSTPRLGSARPEICLTPELVAKVLAKVEPLIDKMSADTGEATTTVKQDGCWKKTYVRRDFQVVLFKKPDEPSHSIEVNMHTTMESDAHTPACWAKAQEDVRTLGLPGANRVLAESEKLNAWRWSDMEIGPVFFIDCNQSDQGQYHDSLATLVHELTHGLRQDNCLYSSVSGRRLCFDLPGELPNRNIAAFDKFPFTDPGQIASAKTIQHHYMEAMDEGPLTLFDELNAYTATANMHAALLKHYGATGMEWSDHQRVRGNLTMFMAYAVRYLNVLKREDKVKFAKYFGPGSQNLANLHVLLRDAETAYQNWETALAGIHEKPSEDEAWFYREAWKEAQR